jgi:transcriptional regulator with XRE-family HTH domain
MLLRHVIGDVLRRVRRERGRTLESVAREASMSMQYLSELERGRKDASSEILRSVCGALGVRLEDVLDEAVDLLRATRAARETAAATRRTRPALVLRARLARPTAVARHRGVGASASDLALAA